MKKTEAKSTFFRLSAPFLALGIAFVLNFLSVPGVYAICGDGFLDGGETCDDSNVTSGDGCSATCQLEGGVKAWGSNTNGRLGNGNAEASAIPLTTIGLPKGISQIANGLHSCALTDQGAVWCWGNNVYGQIGDGGTNEQWIPIEVFSGGVTQIAIGPRHSCALMTDTTVQCWGQNQFGKLGNDMDSSNFSGPDHPDNTAGNCSVSSQCELPVVVCDDAVCAGDLSGVIHISASTNNTCAVMSDNTVKCWGSNSAGQIGDNTSLPNFVPELTPVDVCAIPVCGNGTIEINEECDDGNLSNGDGCSDVCGLETTCGNGATEVVEQCDDGNTISGDGCSQFCQLEVGGDLAPSEFCTSGYSNILTGIDEVHVGSAHVCALDSGGDVKCWGSNFNGQLGDGQGCGAGSCTVPVSVFGISSATHLASGSSVSCAVEGGEAKCWGDNTRGQLGDGTTTERTIAVQVSGLTAGVTAISVGSFTTHTYACAIVSGAAKCWGDNNYGQLGSGSIPYSSCGGFDCALTPVEPVGLALGVVAINAGYSSTLALANSNSCGDGFVSGTEVCDDGNITAGDGCSASCSVESNWFCNASNPSYCAADWSTLKTSRRWALDYYLGSADASFVGEAVDDQAARVFAIGDVNGDGFEDFALGTFRNDQVAPLAGKVYFFFGNADPVSTWGSNFSVSGADASYLGEFAGDRTAHVIAAGDLNGDGFDDVLVSSVTNDEGNITYIDAGQLYVIFGKTSGWSTNVNLGTGADASFLGVDGIENFNNLSRSVVVGDFNGDGYDDIAVSAHKIDENGPNSGKIYVVFGEADAKTNWLMDTLITAVDGASYLGEAAYDLAGDYMGSGGDLNGDGCDDFVISTVYNNGNTGKIYVVFGRGASCANTDAWPTDFKLDDLTSADGASFVGETAGDYTGINVSIIGDINNDGFDDLSITSWYNDEAATDAGQLYLIFGKSSGWSTNVNLDTGADASLLGEVANDRLGSATKLGDVNSDGIDDFMVSAILSDAYGSDAGQSYIVFGQTSGWAMDTPIKDMADAGFSGEAPDDISGIKITGNIDVNKDGIKDFLIGAYGNDDSFDNAGKTYLFLAPSVVSSSRAPVCNQTTTQITNLNAGLVQQDDDTVIQLTWDAFGGDSSERFLVYRSTDGSTNPDNMRGVGTYYDTSNPDNYVHEDVFTQAIDYNKAYTYVVEARNDCSGNLSGSSTVYLPPRVEAGSTIDLKLNIMVKIKEVREGLLLKRIQRVVEEQALPEDQELPEGMETDTIETDTDAIEQALSTALETSIADVSTFTDYDQITADEALKDSILAIENIETLIRGHRETLILEVWAPGNRVAPISEYTRTFTTSIFGEVSVTIPSFEIGTYDFTIKLPNAVRHSINNIFTGTNPLTLNFAHTQLRFGDFDNNNKIDLEDIRFLASGLKADPNFCVADEASTAASFCDINEDGEFNLADLMEILGNWGEE